MKKACDFAGQEFGKKCRTGKVASKTIRVKYNPREEDVLYLCEDCAKSFTEESYKKDWTMTARDYVQSK